MNINNLKRLEANLANTDRYPVLFLGHGSPMNAIENNKFSKEWVALKTNLPTPKAIICISAHWETRGTHITANIKPETIHDFYGFPKELYEYQYDVYGSPSLASDIANIYSGKLITETEEWGLDHGTWSLLCHIYPKQNIPVLQISLNKNQPLEYHYELGQQLNQLRSKGILIIGSGNMIHNLRLIQIKGIDFNQEYGYDWAYEINDILKQKILDDNFKDLINYQKLHPQIDLAVPTLEHYLPLMYVLGMRHKKDNIKFINDNVIAGSLSMTSFILSSNK